MSPNSGEEIFSLDADANFHGGLADKVHARLHDDEIANMDGLPEIHPVHRSRNACLAGVSHGGHGGRSIHHAQDDPAENVAEIIRMLRHHYLRRLVVGIADTPR